MQEIKANDVFTIHRCIYCKQHGSGEYLCILSGRWDENPELDPKTVVGSTVSRNGKLFKIRSDDSSPKLGAPIVFQLVAERLDLSGDVKEIRK